MKQKTQPVDDLSAPRASFVARLRAAVHKRIKAVVALPVAAAVLAAVVVSVLPHRYVATAVLQIDPRHGLIGVETPKGDLVASTVPIESEIAVLRSEPVIASAARTLQLAHDPEIKPNWPSQILASLKSGSDSNTLATAAIYSGLTVSRLRNTLLVTVRFSSPDPAKSARVANAVAAAYLKHEAASRSQLAALGQTSDGVERAKNAAVGGTASERMFASLVAKYGAPLAGARMVTKAEPPSAPASFSRVKITALAFAIGLLAAIGIALSLELRASPRGCASRAKGALACTHVTSIPFIVERSAHAAPSRACRVVLSEPQGSYADAVRDICRMLDARRTGASGRLLLCVSAVHGEGAELFASNIAHELAVAGRSQLLVDTDLQTQGLTRQLAGRSPRGLLDQIASGQPVENAILRDATTGLHFLPAAGQAPIRMQAENVLNSRAMRDGLTGLRRHFESVILSAPPLMAAMDSRALADIADDIIFVTAWNRTPERIAQEALASIGANRRKVAGAVLTDITEGHATAVMSLSDIVGEIRLATAFTPFRSHAA